jgi:replicative DNA helicase
VSEDANALIALPPQDLDCEAALIGTLIAEPEAIRRVAGRLKPEYFYKEFNKALYEACLSLYQDNVPIDNVSVAQRYDELGGRQFQGQRAVIGTLMESSYCTTANVVHYSKIVEELWKRRQGISIHKKGINELLDLSRPVSDSILTSTEQLFALETASETRGFLSLGDEALPEALRALETAQNGEENERVVPYPWAAVTALVPLRRGEVTVVCGRPAMSKSSFVLNAALNAARKNIPVGIFSLEMNKRSIALRLISMTTGLDSRKLEEGQFSAGEKSLILEAAKELAKLPLHIDDNPDLDELNFIARSREAKHKYNLGLIVLDYLTLMTRKKNETDAAAVGSCARTVRKTARMLDIPILEVCQVSRSCEMREDKRPTLSDLRESGEIEQEADIVLALYRNDYYHPGKSPGLCEVIARKHRNGALDTVFLHFTKQTTTFFSLSGAKQ